MPDLFSSPNLWLTIGTVCVLLEIIGVPGIGFFFAGIAGYLVGVLVYLQVVPADNLVLQTGVWLLISAIIGALLWKPMRKMSSHDKAAQQGYSTTIQGEAVILDEDITEGITGKARWSGTIMNAKLAPGHSGVLACGSTTQIVGVQGNVLLLAPKKH